MGPVVTNGIGTDMFNAMIHSGVAEGTCVVIEGNQMIYAGPLDGAPHVGGKLVFFHARDYERFKSAVTKWRH